VVVSATRWAISCDVTAGSPIATQWGVVLTSKVWIHASFLRFEAQQWYRHRLNCAKNMIVGCCRRQSSQASLKHCPESATNTCERALRHASRCTGSKRRAQKLASLLKIDRNPVPRRCGSMESSTHGANWRRRPVAWVGTWLRIFAHIVFVMSGQTYLVPPSPSGNP
jgi:hypothetical protein